MKLYYPERFSWLAAVRGFNQLLHVHLVFGSLEKIGYFKGLMRFVEIFVDYQISLRKVTLEFRKLGRAEKDIIKQLKRDVKFMQWSKVINFDFVNILN